MSVNLESLHDAADAITSEDLKETWSKLDLSLSHLRATLANAHSHVEGQIKSATTLRAQVAQTEPNKQIENILVGFHNKLTAILLDIEASQLKLDLSNVEEYKADVAACSAIRDKVELDEKIAKSQAVEEIYSSLRKVKAIQDVTDSYEKRLEGALCYNEQLKKYRDCSRYHANLKACSEYYIEAAFCPKDLETCNLYKIAVRDKNCNNNEKHCRNYDAKNHEECYKVPALCKNTSPKNLEIQKKATQTHLFALQNIINIERELGFGAHNYDYGYRQGIKEEGRKLQTKEIQRVSKHFEVLYGAKAINTPGAASDVLSKFQDEYCANHNLNCSEKTIPSFVMRQNSPKDCPHLDFNNATLPDAIQMFTDFVESECCGKLSCEC